MKFNFRVEIILLVIILILMLIVPMLLSCTNHSPYKLLEGFVEGFVEGIAKTLEEDDNNKPKEDKEKDTTQTGGMAMDTTDMTVPVEGLRNKKGKKEGFANHQKMFKHKLKHKLRHHDIPLIFDDTPFKPQCCPTTYSNSMGCACMTMPQYTYLIERGGNNVPFSQY